jgi:osmotically-inducible protein OsmY
VRGEVESIEVSDEILGIVGDVPGVTDVVDELEVAGI